MPFALKNEIQNYLFFSINKYEHSKYMYIHYDTGDTVCTGKKKFTNAPPAQITLITVKCKI